MATLRFLSPLHCCLVGSWDSDYLSHTTRAAWVCQWDSMEPIIISKVDGGSRLSGYKLAHCMDIAFWATIMGCVELQHMRK
jgi:hypothetical protein